MDFLYVSSFPTEILNRIQDKDSMQGSNIFLVNKTPFVDSLTSTPIFFISFVIAASLLINGSPLPAKRTLFNPPYAIHLFVHSAILCQEILVNNPYNLQRKNTSMIACPRYRYFCINWIAFA